MLVHPTPLPRPELLTYSRELAAELGLDDAACRSDAFLRFFSGDSSALPQFYGKTWATPSRGFPPFYSFFSLLHCCIFF